MDQSQLEAIVVLSEELHFGRAARRLGMTQPALSQKISRVESDVGVVLFIRGNRRVSLSDAGRNFLPQARSALADMETAVRMAMRAAAGQIGQLHVGFVENASLNVLPRAVSAYRKRFPEVDLRLSEMISADLGERLVAGRIDVALMRPIKVDPAIETRLVHQEPYVAVLPSGHPLAEASKVQVADLAKLPMIIAAGAKATYLRAQFLPLFARAGYEINVGQEVNQLPAILGLVSSGIGYAILPESVAGLYIPGVTHRHLEAPDAPQAELVAAWRNGETNPTVKRFVSLI